MTLERKKHMRETPWLLYEFPNILHGSTFLPWGSDSIVGFKRQRLEFLASEVMAVCRVESCTEMVSIRTMWCKGWSCYIQSEIQWRLAEITCLQEVWEVNVNIRGHAYQKINEVLTQLQWRNHTKRYCTLN